MTEDQFDKLSQQMSRLDDGFTKLYQHMEARFDDLEAKLEAKADRVQLERLSSAIDGVIGRLDTIEIELTAYSDNTDRRLDRHEGWIKQVADHSRVKLEPQN